MGLHIWDTLPDVRLPREVFKSGKNVFPALTGMAQLGGCQPTKQRVTGSIPGLGLGFSPW